MRYRCQAEMTALSGHGVSWVRTILFVCPIEIDPRPSKHCIPAYRQHIGMCTNLVIFLSTYDNLVHTNGMWWACVLCVACVREKLRSRIVLTKSSNDLCTWLIPWLRYFFNNFTPGTFKRNTQYYDMTPSQPPHLCTVASQANNSTGYKNHFIEKCLFVNTFYTM